MSHPIASGCPSEDDIAGFLGDALDAEQRQAFEAHLDSCGGCRDVVAEMVRVFEPSNPASLLPADSATDSTSDAGEHVDPRIAIGTTVGRYRIIEVLGIGGMGIVYSAHDPELDRKVALKVLRSRGDNGDSEGHSARLVREARAMARLSHPNVIAVHDVGTWQGRVFVAMELVQGGTLKDWLGGRARSWSSIWPTLLAAGRGLAAAHEARFVHRDFKPDNVLVSDAGRVFVTDFGLARWAETHTLESDAVPTGDTTETASATVSRTERAHHPVFTQTGMLVGTPAYMAPEQFLRQRVDAACDQFAYCVVLWEALFGERPFKGRTLSALSAQVCESDLPSFPIGANVPRRVRSALARGLAKRPAERYPSMAALLTALDPPRRAWLPWVAASTVTALGVPALLLITGPGEQANAAPSRECESLEGLGDAWSESRRSTLTSALLRSGTPFAHDASERVAAALDAFAEDFVAQERLLCEATETGELDPMRAALRRRCLDERRDMFSDVETALETPDTRMLERAVRVTSSLPSVEACTDDARLQVDILPPPPAAILTEVESVRRALRRAEAERTLGRYKRALDRVDAERGQAETLRFRPLSAELGYLRGRLLLRLGRFEDAAEALERAELDATASHHNQVSANAAIMRIAALGKGSEPWTKIDSAIHRAEAAVEAADPTSKQRASMHTSVAIAAGKLGRTERAVDEYERALRLLDPEREPLEWANASLNLASQQRRRGTVETALPHVRQAIEVFSRELGPTHPDLIEPHRELGVSLKLLERFDEAREAVKTGLEIAAASRGETSYVYGGMLSSLSGIEGEAGNLEEALVLALRSAKILGAADQSTLIPDAQSAEWLILLGRPDEAAPTVDAILAAETKRQGPDSPGLAWIFFVRASLEAARKDVDATRAACDRGIELTPVEPGSDDALTMQLDRAVHLADAGGSAESLASLQRSRDALEAAATSPTTARIYRELALRGWDAGQHDQAIADMRRASAQFAELELKETSAEVDAWLAERG